MRVFSGDGCDLSYALLHLLRFEWQFSVGGLPYMILF